MALNTSEGAGSGRIVVRLPGAHLCKQVLGNLDAPTVAVVSSLYRPLLIGVVSSHANDRDTELNASKDDTVE